jgi:glycosyltransferase involved in cell wall biosynthesis
MFVMNTCTHDARVLKEAQALAQAGYEVRIIAIQAQETPAYEERDGFQIVRVWRDPLHYRLDRLAGGFFLLGNKNSHQSKNPSAASQPQKPADPGPLECSKLFLQHLWQLIKTKLRPLWNRIPQRSRIIRLKQKHWPLGRPLHLLYLGIKDKFRLAIHSGWQQSQLPLRAGWRGFYIAKSLVRRIPWLLYRGLRRLLTPWHRYLFFFEYYQQGLKVVQTQPADIYHAHDLNVLPVAYWAARKTGALVVYDSHELYTERNRLEPVSRWHKFWVGQAEAFLIRKTQATITVNKSIAEELQRRYNVPQPKVVMNIPDDSRLVEVSGRVSIREVLQIPACYRLLIYSGSITFNRGLEQTLQSLPYLPDCYAVFMGYCSPEYKHKLEQLAEQLDVRHRFAFFGPVPSHEVPAYVASADVGVAAIQNVCLSYYYCSPNKLFEYFTGGIPAAVSDFPELRRLIDRYEVGRVFNPEDPRDIARAIGEILNDPLEYERMKCNTAKVAVDYRWANESRVLLDIYRELAQQIISPVSWMRDGNQA